MNALAPLAGRQTIEIVHDFVCPWCYLGIVRLLRALQNRPGHRFTLVWRPFLLNPDIPREGVSRADYALRKYGGEARARRLYAAVTRLGLQDGVLFQFDRMTRIPSSVDAHRLVGWASRFGDATPLVQALFAAQFCSGDDLGDHATLIARAAASGFDPLGAARFLRSQQEDDAVQAENLRAHRAGISGVPCVVLDGSFAVSGAQETEVFQRLLDVAALEMVGGGPPVA